MSKLVPCMWFNGDAEDAAKFYVSLVPNSAITHVQRNVSDGPSGKEGSVLVIEFTVAGQPLVALNGGMKMEYTHAISLMIHCDDQAQVDSVWNTFLAHGGKAERCGWLRDRWGVAWQVVPKVMFEFLSSPDKAAAARAMQAMMKMVKLDVEVLRLAFEGKSAA
ncbi:VOC family protein [Bradyrhizobium sp. CB1015]|uniref:VOC family protein n=1 Tax=Bradyrhizobium sp. CB1015 TaxID=2976822 RepID=UPI0021AA4C98|nr:VOC family protein [Bradyrhizobium sp. CB1015]UWU91267.1 VOC family protein [Bradyrhizobium sp. CB1015]